VLLKLPVAFGKFGKWCYQHMTNSMAAQALAVTYAHLQ